MINEAKGVTILCHDPFEILKVRTWIDYLIRKITSSQFNHAIQLLKDFDNKKYIAHATSIGVVLIPIDNFLKRYPNRKYFFSDHSMLKCNVDIAKSLLGLDYQFSIFFKFPLFCFLRKILGVHSKLTKWATTEANDNKYFCFEYSAVSSINCDSLSKTLGLPSFSYVTGKDFENHFKFDNVTNIKEISL